MKFIDEYALSSRNVCLIPVALVQVYQRPLTSHRLSRCVTGLPWVYVSEQSGYVARSILNKQVGLIKLTRNTRLAYSKSA